ncbi:MAG: ketoacyl-ACP synthase III [Candidatus Krumholzibacteria bacterium]|nr:ketoacyl-ACP synthase III [Candidatus Krumholzibacteria bacterium]
MVRESGPRSAKFAGLGYYLPERVLTNFDFEKMVDTSDEWIVTRTGIRERHIAKEEEAASDLAINAARKAMADARVEAKDIDLIVVGTATSDYPFPSTASIVQREIGARNAAAFDVAAACSGFIYSITIAQSMIIAGKVRRALVIGVETLSRITDYTDRTTCVLFGDGAGAVVLDPCESGEGILATCMKTDGSYTDLLYQPVGGSRTPLTEERIRNREQFVKMKGDGLFKYAVKAMVGAAETVLRDAGLKISDIDFVIPHQANLRIIDGVRNRLGVSPEKVIVNIDRVGNTSSASIPIAFCEAKDKEIIKRDDLILMVAFGGGLTWGAALLKY